jgi:hypothetical protein
MVDLFPLFAVAKTRIMKRVSHESCATFTTELTLNQAVVSIRTVMKRSSSQKTWL